MRPSLLPALFALAAGPAGASSIEMITTGPEADTAGSIETITCGNCPPVPQAVAVNAYQVPTITSGTEKREIRNVNGQMKLLRTEAWLGGSPVTFVSALPPDLFKGMDSQSGVSLASAATTSVGTLIAAGGVDAATQTASVTDTTKGAAPVAADMTSDRASDTATRSQGFDASGLQLRVN